MNTEVRFSASNGVRKESVVFMWSLQRIQGQKGQTNPCRGGGGANETVQQVPEGTKHTPGPQIKRKERNSFLGSRSVV